MWAVIRKWAHDEIQCVLSNVLSVYIIRLRFLTSQALRLVSELTFETVNPLRHFLGFLARGPAHRKATTLTGYQNVCIP
jgi:hypothetical protein